MFTDTLDQFSYFLIYRRSINIFMNSTNRDQIVFHLLQIAETLKFVNH